MKYIRQFLIILAVSFLGEALHALLPLPIPGGIYGLLLLLLALCLKIVKPEQIRETSSFLLKIMPVLFVPACVGLIGAWDYLKPKLWAYLLILLISYFLVFAVSGFVAQKLGKGEKKE